jgi:hypothetical protein
MKSLIMASFVALTLLHPSFSFGCSVLDFEAHRIDQLILGYRYWCISALLALLIAVLNRRYLSLKRYYFIPAVFIVFHPAWLVQPEWSVGCEAENVFYSKAIVGVLILTLMVCSLLSVKRVFSVH